MSLYHSMLTMPWLRFNINIVAAYIVFNVLFAIGYVLCGEGALSGAAGGTTLENLAESFFFSVQTSTTIGYGHITPAGVLSNILVGLEGMLSLLGFAIAAGFIFARFSRPNAKVLFSDHALIAPYRGITAFEFRIANQRSNQLIQVEAKVMLSRIEQDESGKKRRFYELSLERQSVVFFPLSWTIVHPIDERSPLFNVTQQSFVDSDPEVFVLLTAIDETYSQTVHSRSSYKAHEIVWDARFVDMFEPSKDGSMSVDLDRLHLYEKIESLKPAAP